MESGDTRGSSMNLQDWIAKYEQKSREKFKPKEDFELFLYPKKEDAMRETILS